MASELKRVRAKKIGLDLSRINIDVLELLCSRAEEVIRNSIESKLSRRIIELNVIVKAELADVLTFTVDAHLVARASRNLDLEVLLDDAIERGLSEIEKILRSKFRAEEGC